jgi:hypothetical protein
MKNGSMGVEVREYLQLDSVRRILGLKEDVPLSLEEMRANLKVTFSQIDPISEVLSSFLNKLRLSFEELGIQVLEFIDTLDESNKVKPDITVFVAGLTNETESLMVSRVSSLYKNPIVALYEGESPVNPEDTNQDKLNSIISVLAYDVVHFAVFVNDLNWTICTMNGAIITTSHGDEISSTIENCLIPKLTAQVIPPNILTNIDFRYDSFNPLETEYSYIIDDIKRASLLLKEDGLIMSHTKVSSLSYKNKFHERVVNTYLDHRTGMSYGFMTWQLPVKSKPALIDGVEEHKKFTDTIYVNISFLDKNYLVEVPEVWVIATRSGSDKSKLDISRDIVRMGLSNGKITLDLPVGVNKGADVKPSYDTLAILAHAVSNSIVSSILKAELGDNTFSQALDTKGLSLFHWHGFIEKGQFPHNHFEHGEENPSVSCSTQQSAVYSLIGKLESLENSIISKTGFQGDIHVEPHHGTNISSILSLSEIVEFLN